jgi:hypothetical protein
MAVDGDGVAIVDGGQKWFDDGHSVDAQGVPVWTHGTVISFGSNMNGVPVATLQAGTQYYVRPDQSIHENKPNDPPDR